jgi:hypothetical protein
VGREGAMTVLTIVMDKIILRRKKRGFSKRMSRRTNFGLTSGSTRCAGSWVANDVSIRIVAGSCGVTVLLEDFCKNEGEESIERSLEGAQSCN